MRGYLGGTAAFDHPSHRLATLSILLLWLVAIVTLSAGHPMWRDEVRALSVATAPASIWQLPWSLPNQGHPLLWYAMLRIAFSIAHTPVVLKIVSVLVALAGVVVFLRHAPLPVWQKLIFMWGVLPAYEYSVRCRNYGISMLLLFAFAALYSSRTKRPIAIGIVLALLANTNIHACILAVLLVALWLFDDVVLGLRSLDRRAALKLGVGLAVACAGIWMCIVTVLPTRDTVALDTTSLTRSHLLHWLSFNLLHPGSEFEKAFPALPARFRDPAILLFAAGLLTRPSLALLLYLGAVSLGTFSLAIYPVSLRQQGLLVIFMLVLYWIAAAKRGDSSSLAWKQWLAWLHRQVSMVGLALLLLAQVAATIHAGRRDRAIGWSPSGAFARFIRAHAETRGAILIGEPDFFMEPMPYYVPNRIYIPRESRFGKTVSFTSANRDSMSLGELLTDARAVRERERRPVLLALGHRAVTVYPRGVLKYSYRRFFTWTPAEVAAFAAGTIRVASFDTSVSGERYEIYLLR